MRARSFARRSLPIAGAVAVYGAALVLPSAAHATCPNTIGGTADLDALDPTTRADFVRQALEADASNANLWTWGWTGVGAATAVGNGIWAAASDYDQRIDHLGAASGGAMLAVTAVLAPMSVTHDAAIVGTAIDASAPGRAGYDPCGVVAYAERYLVRSADDEAGRRGFVDHALPVGGSIAGGLVLGFGYGHWTAGAVNAGIGVVMTEIKILTQPTGAVRALERYRSGVLGKDGPTVGWQLSPLVAPGGGGISLAMVY